MTSPPGLARSTCSSITRVSRTPPPLEKYTIENFDRVMDLNVKAPFVCTKAAVEWMKKQGAGVILNTSSMVSTFGQPSGVAYPTSKFAINGMTKSLGARTGKIRHPRQRRGAGHHGNGHG